MTPIHVEVRASTDELADHVRRLPRELRWRPRLDWLWRAIVAFAPAPIALALFGLWDWALAWLGIGALGIAIAFIPEFNGRRRALAPGAVFIDADGVHAHPGDLRLCWPWYAVRELFELSDGAIVIALPNRELVVVPHASFGDPDHRRAFVEAARAQLRAHSTAAPPLELGVQPTWPDPIVIGLGVALATGLGWLAFDAEFLPRLICGPLAALALGLALPELKSTAPEREIGPPGARPDRPQPGTTHTPSPAGDVARVRIAIVRPSATATTVAVAIALALLYAAGVTGTLGTAVCGVVALAALTLASLELFELLDWWWPLQLRRAWREVEVGPLGVEQRDVRERLTVDWDRLGEPVVGKAELELRWSHADKLVVVPYSAFTSAAARDEFIAIARSRARARA